MSREKRIQVITDRLLALLDSGNDDLSPTGLALLGQAVLLHKLNVTVSNPFSDVREFHAKMGIPVNKGELPAGLQAFRDGILLEEFDEYIDAVKKDNLSKQFDALLDIIYVACGTIAIHGWNGEEGWRRVHFSNMAKYPGKPGEGKAIAKETNQVDILKPEGWKPPHLKDLV